MAIPNMTLITGSLYTPLGVEITSGTLYVTLDNPFISIDGLWVAPFRKAITITGALSFSLYANSNTLAGSSYPNCTPATTRYLFEYCSGIPTNTIRSRQDGYFKARVLVPWTNDTTSTITLGELLNSAD